MNIPNRAARHQAMRTSCCSGVSLRVSCGWGAGACGAAIVWRGTEFVSGPLARHEFLNLRTYVIHQNERGVFFLAEWISSVLAVFLGPRFYGLPYKRADLNYETAPGLAVRRVVAKGEFSCRAAWNPAELPAPAEGGSETEFLVERYCAYTLRGRTLRRFRISH